jgi:hypothetical protein
MNVAVYSEPFQFETYCPRSPEVSRQKNGGQAEETWAKKRQSDASGIAEPVPKPKSIITTVFSGVIAQSDKGQGPYAHTGVRMDGSVATSPDTQCLANFETASAVPEAPRKGSGQNKF